MSVRTFLRIARLGAALGCSLPWASVARAQDDAAARSAATYVRPGDLIVLHFLRERQLSDSVFVSERGDAAFPKLGVLPVSQLTIGALQDTLRKRYSEYLRVPEFQIFILRRVVVNGEVRIPNIYMVDGASTVRDVIARAGGITETGNRGRVVIVRDGKTIPVKGWDQSTGPAMDLRSGDQVFVGRKSWLVMNALSVISTAVLVTSFIISISR